MSAPNRSPGRPEPTATVIPRRVSGGRLARPDGGPPLRLALLVNMAPRKLGSVEAWLIALAEEARRRGHRVDIWGRDPVHASIAARLDAAGIGWRHVSEIERHPYRAARRLAREYDVLHLNLFGVRDRVPLAAYAAWPARVLFAHHLAVLDPASRPRFAGLRRALDRVSVARTHEAGAVSEYVRGQVQRRFAMPASRVRLIYNGIDLERFPPPVGRGDRHPVRIFTVANLHPWKGVEHLIRAMAMLDPAAAELEIAGDGVQADALRALAESLRLSDRVRFLGLRDDIPALLGASDIFVHPVVVQDACPYGIIEAMAAGCAIIASRMGGIPELVQDGESGVLLPPADPRAIADALARLVADSAERRRLGENARRRAAERFTLEECVAEHLGWCEAAVAR